MPTADSVLPLTAWVSEGGSLHLDLSCSTLDVLRAAGRNLARTLLPVEYHHPRSLAGLSDFHCRVCALEPILTDVLTNAEDGGEPSPTASRVVTFTLEPPQTMSSLWSHQSPYQDPAEASDRNRAAAERMTRIAAAAGLRTTGTVAGLAAYGFVPETVVALLPRLVKVGAYHPEGTALPSAELIATFWALKSDPSVAAAEDLWDASALICATAN